MKRGIKMDNNKNIGLLSLHWMNNYGTILQTFALQKAIKNEGYYSEYICYLPKNGIAKKSIVNIFIDEFPSSLRRVIPFIKNRLTEYRIKTVSRKIENRNYLFEKFRKKYIKVGEKIYLTEEELNINPPKYDIYITGSDQIWNPNLSYSNEAFMLKFIKENSRKNAYASSIGIVNITNFYKKTLYENLKDFNLLSCREATGVRILEEILSRKVMEVVDPTMLLCIDDFYEIAVPYHNMPKEYMLCYFLGDKKWQRRYSKKVAKIRNIPIFYIAHNSNELGKKNALWDVGPQEFVSLLMNATCICTDSFHGSVLSLIFHRDLFGFCKRDDSEKTSDNSRLKDFYKKFSIENRLILYETCDPINCGDIDYIKVDQIIKKEKKTSYMYLKKILGY